ATRWSGGPAPPPSDPWAVGAYPAGSVGKTLTARWNGTAWKQTASPSPGTSASSLRGVTATSASNVWAVGDFSSGGPSQVFAIHCCLPCEPPGGPDPPHPPSHPRARGPPSY